MISENVFLRHQQSGQISSYPLSVLVVGMERDKKYLLKLSHFVYSSHVLLFPQLTAKRINKQSRMYNSQLINSYQVNKMLSTRNLPRCLDNCQIVKKTKGRVLTNYHIALLATDFDSEVICNITFFCIITNSLLYFEKLLKQTMVMTLTYVGHKKIVGILRFGQLERTLFVLLLQ